MSRPSILQHLRLSPAVLAWLLVAALVRGFLPPGVMPAFDGGIPGLTLCATDGGAALLGGADTSGAAPHSSDHLCPYAFAAAAGLTSVFFMGLVAWLLTNEPVRAAEAAAAPSLRAMSVRARGPPTWA